MEYYFSADPHFDHKNIITLCNRPFKNVDDMNRSIIDGYNKKIKPNDVFYILGDFGWGDAESLRRHRAAINCNNVVFIWGNHDKVLRSYKKLANQLFESTHDILDINIDGQLIVLCHYPMKEWNRFFHGSWHLYGHVHGNLSPDPGTLACDVGVDCHNYEPVAFQELQVIMDRRKKFNATAISDNVKGM